MDCAATGKYALVKERFLMVFLLYQVNRYLKE
jgi:hypothetical protein